MPSEQWFDDFVDATRVALTSYVRRLTGSHEDAKDVVQEAYLKVFCRMRAGTADHQPAAFLYVAARNLAVSRHRHNTVVAHKATAVTVSEELRTSNRSTEHQAGRREQMQMLLLAVNKLPPKCRSVFVMRMIDGMSQRDIADELGISVSTVEKHLSKGLQLCRAEIQGSTCAEPVPAPARRRVRAVR